MIAQFARFIVIGVVGTALDFALFWTFLRAGIWQPLAVGSAYLIATALQFVANRSYTFRAYAGNPGLQALVYAGVTAASVAVTIAVVQIATQSFGVAPLAAKALAIPPSVAIGFLGNRYLTFRNRTCQ